MTPDEIAADVLSKLKWTNDTQWHSIIAAALTAERTAREKAEAEVATWIERHDLKRDELFKAEAERDECRAAQKIRAKAIRDAKAEARTARNAALWEAAAEIAPKSHRHVWTDRDEAMDRASKRILALIEKEPGHD